MKRLASLAIALFLSAASVVAVTAKEAEASPYRGYGYQTPYSRDRVYRRSIHPYYGRPIRPDYGRPIRPDYRRPGRSYYRKPGYFPPGKRVYTPGFRRHGYGGRSFYSPYYGKPGYYR